MKKRLFAAILAALMLASTSAVAFADDTPSVAAGNAFGEYSPDVTTDVQDAIIEFSVPTSIAVGLDPFQAGDASGSQIYSNAQGIYNKSNIPIRVTVKAGVVIGLDTDDSTPLATLEAAASDVSSSDIADTDKKAYVELIAEKATATTDRSGAVVIEATKLEGKDYATAYAEDSGAATTAKVAVKEATVSGSGDSATITYDSDSQLSFALQAATFAADRSGALSFSALAENNKGIASFRFMGSLNANAANWSADDLSVKVVYDVNGMGTAAYTALMDAVSSDADKTATNVYAVGATGGSQNPGTTSPSLSPATATATFSGGSWDVDPTTTLSKGDWDALNITSVTWADNATTPNTGTFAETNDYTYNSTDGEFVILGANATSGKGLQTSAIDASATKLTVTIAVENSDSSMTDNLTFEITLS